MTAILTTCRQCGQEFAPTHSAIVAGSWRICPACSPAAAEPQQCRACGRPLRTAGRTICVTCLGGAAL